MRRVKRAVRPGTGRAGGACRRTWAGVLGVVASLLLAGIASAAVIGVNEDATKFAEDGGASLFGQMQEIGLRQNVVSATWTAGRQLNATDVARINRAVAAGKARGVKVVVAIYPAQGANARALGTDGGAAFIDFVKQVVGSFHGTVRDFIVLNEPNRTIFASPVDPKLTAKVLADAYDAIKAIDAGIDVIGLGLSPRGTGDRRSLFPVQFLAQLGAAYKALNRATPLMDAISFHPYPFPEDKAPDKASDWPTIGMADLARLKQAISDAFAGTAQKAVEGGLPIHLDEVAYQMPTDGKPGYSGNETVKVVDEATQARYYAQIVQQVACDPSIASLSFFHFVDETDRPRFQSGFFDAALGARPAVAAVKQALAETAGGTKCTGTPVNWVPEHGVVGFDPGFTSDGRTALANRSKVWGFTPRAEEDATYKAGVFAAGVTEADAARSLQVRGHLTADAKPLFTSTGKIPAMLKSLAKFELTGKNGTYVYAITATSTTNPNRTETAVSEPFTVGTTVARIFGGKRLTKLRNCPLFGSDGRDTILCGFLADRISALGGNDTIDAGGGNDVVSGGFGDDTITGGPGSDQLLGDDGNDVFNARDGERDVIYGGPGFDRAVIDAGLDEVHDVEIVTLG